MTDYSVNRLNFAAWLVYINGLEIPVSSVRVSFSLWGQATAELDMVPHHLLERIGHEDRLQVVIFYLDTHWHEESPEFCLLGEFEVVGYAYNNTPNNRFVQLQCASKLKIFEEWHFYYISSLNDIVVSGTGPLGSDPSTSVAAKVLYPASLFLEGLTSPESIYGSLGASETNFSQGFEVGAIGSGDRYIKRPIEFVLNLFRSVLRPVSTVEENKFTVPGGSTELPRGATSVISKNFYARWFELTQFHRRWAALPVLEDVGAVGCFPLLKAAQDTQTLMVLEQQVGQDVGNAGTAWDLLQMVLGYMLMEIAVIPAPPSVNTEQKTYRILGPRDGSPGDSILEFFVKPQCAFAIPPVCNVIFPCMIGPYTVSEDYRVPPTRLYLGETYLTAMLTQSADAPMTSIMQAAMSTAYPPAVRKRMQDLINSPESNEKNLLLFPEEFYRGPNTSRLSAPPWMYLLSQSSNANTSSTGTVQEAVNDIPPNDPFTGPLGTLFNLYAEYEFFRQKYAAKSGGLSVAWNPYLIPGFPAMVFDRATDGFDVMAYISSVQHTLSAGSGSPTMSTAVSFTYARTSPEYMGINVPKEGNTTKEIDVFPVEVIPDVSNAFQVVKTATDLYRKLLFRGDTTKTVTAFNWKDMLNVTNREGETITPSYEALESNGYLGTRPKEQFSELFTSRDAAMRFVARPVCTLKDYIEIHHGKTLANALVDGDVTGELLSFYDPASDTLKTRGAVFWSRIYKMVQGPGPDPGVAVTNVGSAPDYRSAGDGNVKFVGKSTGVAQTRRDWDKILEEYRTIIRSEAGKRYPQE